MNKYYIFLGVPHLGHPSAHLVTDKRIVDTGEVFVDRQTPRQFLKECYGYDNTDEAREDGEDGIADYVGDLEKRFGLNTLLYHVMSDNDDEWSVKPFNILELSMQNWTRDLSYGVFIQASEVAGELARLRGPNAPRIGKCGPLVAAAVLEETAKRFGFL